MNNIRKLNLKQRHEWVPRGESLFWPRFFMPEHAPSFDLWNILPHYPLFRPDIFGVCTCGWGLREWWQEEDTVATNHASHWNTSGVEDNDNFLRDILWGKNTTEISILKNMTQNSSVLKVLRISEKANQKGQKSYRKGRESVRGGTLWVDAKMAVTIERTRQKMLNSIDGKMSLKRTKVCSDVPIWYWNWLSMRNNLMM